MGKTDINPFADDAQEVPVEFYSPAWLAIVLLFPD
jgi:hypothetical protein